MSTESKCPFHSAHKRTAGGHAGNRGWWPEQLNLSILHQHPSQSNPMGPAFDYAEQFKSCRPTNRAFTWVVSTPRPALRKYRLSGGTFGSSGYVEFYPSLGYGVALLANRAAAQTQDDLQEIAERAFKEAQGSLSACAAPQGAR